MIVSVLLAASGVLAPLPEKIPVIELERGVLERYVPNVPSGAHVQGFCMDENFIYVSQMRKISKFDWTGRLVKRVAAPSHTGDICVHDGKLYAAVAYWEPGTKLPEGVKGAIWEYDADLNSIRHRDYPCEFDGIDVLDGKLYVGAGPNPIENHRTNRFMRVSLETLGQIDVTELDYGHETHFGAQNVASDGERIYAVFYSDEGKGTVVLDKDLNVARIVDTSETRGASGCGFTAVPKALAGDRRLFAKLNNINSRLEKLQHGEQNYATIEFLEIVNGKFVDVTDRRRIVHPPASPGRGFIGAYQPGKRWDTKRLMIGVSGCAPYGQKESHVRKMKECGVDYVNGPATREVLDLYLKYGIGTFMSGVYPHWWGGGAETENGKMDEVLPLERYDDLAKGFVDHPAIWGLDVGDEPSALDFRHYGNVVQKTAPMFPNQIPYLCIYPCYALPGSDGKTDAAKSQLGVPSYRAYIEEYCRQMPLDYIKTDFYPWGRAPKGKCSWMIENLRIVADAALASGRGWGATMQANRYFDYGRYGVPMTANKMRFQAFNAMAFGTAHVQWGCWTKGWWTDNMVNEDGSFNEPALARLKEVNGEIHRLGEEYMKFRRVSTELVAYKGTALDDGYIRQPFVRAARSPAFEDVRLKDGSALTVGHMAARDGSGRYAMMVVAVDDPDDERSSPKHTLVFNVPFGRKVTAFGGRGALEVKDSGGGSCAVGIRANEGVLVVAEDPI